MFAIREILRLFPGPALFASIGGLTLLGLMQGVLAFQWQPGWPFLAYVVVGMALTDAVLARGSCAVEADRTVEHTLPLGVDCEVQLSLRNVTSRALTLRLWDHHPSPLRCEAFPLPALVMPRGRAVLRYAVLPVRRGEHRFGPLELRVRSPLAFWWRSTRISIDTAVRVYPNFAPVTKYIQLGVDARELLFGVRRTRRRGSGSEFHELRDYRSGDSMRQIDWRATARLRRLISRAYEDERDQRVVFLLDCGRRMRSLDGEGPSHFDESLNAVLLLSYMALRQGDSVAIGTFGHGAEERSRWMGPIKGPSRVNDVLNMLYDLEPSSVMPDYVAATTELLTRHRKHALVVVVTNLRGEDASDLLPALKILGRHHLVLLASLREGSLDDAMEAAVWNLDDALRAAGATQLVGERRALLGSLRAEGILALDVSPRKLSVELLNAYLSLKASRVL